MSLIALQFPTIVELIDFELIVNTQHLYIDRKNLIIKGNLTEADIELAKHGYQAVVVEELKFE
jgi:hypothetical protein